MKNSYSNIFNFNKKILHKTIIYLKKGNVVGLPTETVYGLAGNAYMSESINKIYKFKNRPKRNPLIIHYFNHKQAEQDVIMNKNFYKLYKKFCPGPITFILKRKKNCKVKFSATANLNSVAIRFPKHRIMNSLLKNIEFPLAMPSANKSSRVSPVSAKNVADEFQKKIKIIIDGGKANLGIESTVIDLTGHPKILRPGLITPENLSQVLKIKVKIINKNKTSKSPGLLRKHYSPGIPVIINQKNCKKNCALITFGKKYKNRKNFYNLSRTSNLKEAASKLYETFRKIKKNRYKKIYVVKIPNKGIGIAINDRLKRASN